MCAKKKAEARRIRLDELLISSGYAADADEAARLIIAGEVRIDKACAKSPAALVSPDSEIEVKSVKKYVSRGGLKLEHALAEFSIDAHGKRCLDIGSSTGGFTDCLLKAGAEHVSAVDVNYGQFDWALRNDPRVSLYERTNIRKTGATDLDGPFDLIVMDVSFISLGSLAPKIAELSTRGTEFIGLIKPQFECPRGSTEHGIVVDEAIRRNCVASVVRSFEDAGFEVSGTTVSPIHGAKGNVEYLMHAIYK
ncbi:MAG: TlyA family RNA methyltransferase [Eggerthellaceae bacterium]|nr:TlyA family RNA methyltransferase [Eggerthellaceae bacterium]